MKEIAWKQMASHSKTFYWYQFYQIAQSLGLFRVAASRAQAWSQLARKKAGCLESAQAVLPKHLIDECPAETVSDDCLFPQR